MVNMVHIFHPTFWTDWRTQITFQLIKLLFALTAVPFFIFTIGPTAKIFSHTDPTAWTRDGRCVKPGTCQLLSILRPTRPCHPILGVPSSPALYAHPDIGGCHCAPRQTPTVSPRTSTG